MSNKKSKKNKKNKAQNPNYNFTPLAIKQRRTFPTLNAVIIVILVIIQVLMIYYGITVEPKPQDTVKNYSVTVEPLADGSLDIEYSFIWKALDTKEDLTWVEIGMANSNYTVYEDSLSKNISCYNQENYDGYVYLNLTFEESYIGGDVFSFSFKINQNDMLCMGGSGYFYEFIPCWFNETPVEKYNFKWIKNEHCTFGRDSIEKSRYYQWTGSLDYGEYVKMCVGYSKSAFADPLTTVYVPFDDSGAYNAFEARKEEARVLLGIGFFIILCVEVFLIDSFVSYNRGRGFLSSEGHNFHLYGRLNPRQFSYTGSRTSSGGGSFRGGGCACACACACAGGGRAGCSQKDGYSFTKSDK